MTGPAILETALNFACEGDRLVGVLTGPSSPAPRTGVLVIVGGPQYRAGSHRQFVHLSRLLATAGIACMRFDCRGMGDSEGAVRTFEAIDPDIRAAIDAFVREIPSMERVVLWGLCDGASAACLYAPTDSRVTGLVLANPWVRTEATKAETYLRHYYVRRLVEPAFWKKLLSGRFSLIQSARSFLGLVQASGSASIPDRNGADGTASFRALPFPRNMAGGLAQAGRDVLIVLSGNDYTATEFRDVARSSPDWDRALRRNRVTWREIKESDHTFSTESWRTEVADITLQWLRPEPS